MTIDEALEKINQGTECVISWRNDTGEIVSVKNLDVKVSPENFFQLITDSTRDISRTESGEPVGNSTRFLSCARIDKNFLENERDQMLESNSRVNILNQWTEQPIGELIEILEEDSFPFPSSAGDTYILLERIFDYHWHQIGEPELKRLWNIHHEYSESEDKILLKFHLLFFEKRIDEFIEFYKEVFKNPFYFISRDIDYYIGDLQITDEQILSELGGRLMNPRVLFGVKSSAMIALGKIGNPAGEKFAQIIEAVIFNSTEKIIRVRNLVLERLRTPAENWKRCAKCYFGRLPGSSGRMKTMETCSQCDGLGWVRKS